MLSDVINQVITLKGVFHGQSERRRQTVLRLLVAYYV